MKCPRPSWRETLCCWKQGLDSFSLESFWPGTEEAGSSVGRAEATAQRNRSSRRMPRSSSLIPGNPHSFGSRLATLEAYGQKQPAHVKTRGLDSDMINLGQPACSRLAVSVLLILSWRQAGCFLVFAAVADSGLNQTALSCEPDAATILNINEIHVLQEDEQKINSIKCCDSFFFLASRIS